MMKMQSEERYKPKQRKRQLSIIFYGDEDAFPPPAMRAIRSAIFDKLKVTFVKSESGYYHVYAVPTAGKFPMLLIGDSNEEND